MLTRLIMTFHFQQRHHIHYDLIAKYNQQQNIANHLFPCKIKVPDETEKEFNDFHRSKIQI